MPTWIVTAEEAGARVDKFLADRLATVSRSRVRQLIESGDALVGSETVKPARVLRSGETVQVTAGPSPARVTAQPVSGIPIEVVYTDESIVVVSKPAGLVTHPGAGREVESVASALLALFPDIEDAFAGSSDPVPESTDPIGPHDASQSVGFDPGVIDDADPARYGIVHRLDRETSGLLVAARTPEVARALIAQFASRNVEKLYLAMVVGTPVSPRALIDAPIGRDPARRQQMAAIASGKPAVTEYSVLDRGVDLALLEARPLTGRTHQIRVHLAAIGHPVVGDSVYGHGRKGERLMLHACRLAFDHPSTGARATFAVPPTDEFVRAVEEAGLDIPPGALEPVVFSTAC